jgi:UDP-N-acetylglucosamine transferase subunit ALG13
MIFVTVGSQTPFDRLIRAVDEWAGKHARTDVFAQIAATSYRPEHIEYKNFLTPTEFGQAIQRCSVIVAHAGMGTIISALELGKQVVVMPRRASLHETRNDHQVATAQRFGAQGRIIVANDEYELPHKLAYASSLGEANRIDTHASPLLLATLREFLEKYPRQLSPNVPPDHSEDKADLRVKSGMFHGHS